MFSGSATVDRAGRLALPREALDALGIATEGEVSVETTDSGLLIRRKRTRTPLTDAIAAMSLPVADWEQMEADSQAGRL